MKKKIGTLSLPSPNPKHCIKLSSSKGDSVRPIIEMACSYGFGVRLMACRDSPPKECLPTEIQQDTYSVKRQGKTADLTVTVTQK